MDHQIIKKKLLKLLKNISNVQNLLDHVLTKPHTLFRFRSVCLYRIKYFTIKYGDRLHYLGFITITHFSDNYHGDLSDKLFSMSFPLSLCFRERSFCQLQQLSKSNCACLISLDISLYGFCWFMLKGKYVRSTMIVTMIVW